jgi:hypothetical protein
MKTHLAQDDCPRAADLPPEDKRRCPRRYRPYLVCGQWTFALQRESGMIRVVVAAATVGP